MFQDHGAHNMGVASPIVLEMCAASQEAIGVRIQPPPMQGRYPSYKGTTRIARFYAYNAPLGILTIHAESHLERRNLLAPIAHELGAAAIYQSDPHAPDRELYWRAHLGICAHVELALLRAIGESRIAEKEERKLTRRFFARRDASQYTAVRRAITQQGLAALVANPLASY